jgi:hypothetical protein
VRANEGRGFAGSVNDSFPCHWWESVHIGKKANCFSGGQCGSSPPVELCSSRLDAGCCIYACNWRKENFGRLSRVAVPVKRLNFYTLCVVTALCI